MRQFPRATALVHGQARLTYTELDLLSEHYAVALEKAGIGRGDIVPVILDRTPQMVAALPALRLGDATGTVATGMDEWTSSSIDICMEVRPGPSGDMSLRVVVRTDIYPADLALTIGRLFLEIINDGPSRLGYHTAG